jgi:catechol 2,3-dioxygenase-like lactoylglutathione lyase family enzyme
MTNMLSHPTAIEQMTNNFGKELILAVHHLHHFNIRAPAALLDSIRDFYVEVLGLVDGDRPPFRFAGYWLYADGHPVAHLMAAREGQALPGEAGSIDHVAFACSDYEAMCRHLRQRGIEFRTSTVPGTAQRQVFFRDPIGNGIELNFTPSDTRTTQ